MNIFETPFGGMIQRQAGGSLQRTWKISLVAYRSSEKAVLQGWKGWFPLESWDPEISSFFYKSGSSKARSSTSCLIPDFQASSTGSCP